MNAQHCGDYRAELADAVAILKTAQTSGDAYLERLAANKVTEIRARGHLFGVDVLPPAPTGQRPVSAAVQARSDRTLAFLAAQEKRHQARLAGVLTDHAKRGGRNEVSA